MADTVYLNGEYLPLADAKVSVLDRGFLFGDGVYEVIAAYNGHFFRLAEHIDRLNHSLQGIRLPLDYSVEQWQAILQPLLGDFAEQSIYLQITRGFAPKRDHAFPAETRPTVFAMCSEIKPFAGKITGIKAITLDDNRWSMCHVKAITLLANLLLRQTAVEQGCGEAILIKNGFATEGAASNLFVVLHGVLVTPPKSHEILPGITRDVILELAQAHGIAWREAEITVVELHHASEIWVTSSTREIVPVIELDGIAIGDGKPGALFLQMDALFQAFKRTV